MVPVNIRQILLSVYVLAVLIATCPYWVDWLQENIRPMFLWLNDAIEEKLWFNIMTAVTVCVAGLYIITKLYKRRSVFQYMTLIFIMYIGIVQKDNLFNLSICGDFTYSDLIVVMSGLTICVMLYSNNKERKRNDLKNRIDDSGTANNENSKESAPSFFITTTPHDLLENVNMAGFVDLLTKRIMLKSNTAGVLSIGIVARWGYGKSQMLEHLRVSLEENEIKVICFNPWMCESKSQIITEFFSLLLKHFSEESEDEALYNQILSYSELLTKIGMSSTTSEVLQFFHKEKPNKSITEQKAEINEKLGLLDNPIVIILDDLDRMESGEILSVFKLIRAIADFDNLVFVSAYDREHIIRHLESANVQNAEQYIKKMFSVEKQMPAYEPYLHFNYLGKLLRDVLPAGSASALEKNIKTKESDLQHSILTTFRDVNRFYNLFLLNKETLVANKAFNDVNIVDLYFISLLEYHDGMLFAKLTENPNDFLHVKNDKDGVLYYTVNDKYSDTYEQYHSKHSYVSLLSYQLLSVLFPLVIRKERRLCVCEEFKKYIQLRLSPYQISTDEYCKLFDADYKVDALVKSLMEKSTHSLMYRIAKTQQDKLKESYMARFCDLLFEVMKYPLNSKEIAIVVDRVYFVAAKKYDYGRILKERIFGILNSDTVPFFTIAIFMKYLYEKEEYNIKNAKFSLSGWKEEDLHDMASLNLTRFIEKEKPSISMLENENTTFYKLVMATAVTDYDEDENLPYLKTQLARDAIGSYIRNHDDKDVFHLLDSIQEKHHIEYEEDDGGYYVEDEEEVDSPALLGSYELLTEYKDKMK